MSDEKIPWPGIWALQKCWWYANGWTSDRSGWDAINLWGTTATPEEMEQRQRQAYWMGFLIGTGVGYTVVNSVFRFFGSHDRE